MKIIDGKPACGGLFSLLILAGIVAILLPLLVPGVQEVRLTVRQKKSENNLKQLYMFMTIYEQSFNCYPSMQPTNDVPRRNSGVRDLYPLYLSAVDKQQFLMLLRPPGVKLAPFSKNPGPDEFDTNHIGYLYNSTIGPNRREDQPLMAERCVEDGKFTADEKPVFKNCAHILMANGTIKKLPGLNGKLSLGDIKLEDLGKLK